MTDEPTTKKRLAWPWRLARLVVLAYVGLCVFGFAVQNWMIFPGRVTQGTDEAAALRRIDGDQLLRLGERRDIVLYVGPIEPGRPTVLMFHGNGDCLSRFQPWALDVASRGVNVAVLEYPGYGLSGGKPSEASINAAALLAFDALAAQPGVDADRVAVLGVSLGGGPAVELTTRRPVAGLATMSTFTSLQAMGRRVLPFLPIRLILRHRFANVDKLPGITVPTFITHGTEDSIIPFEMAGELRDAAGGEVTWRPVDKADHNDLFQIGGEALLSDLIGWLNALPPVAVESSP